MEEYIKNISLDWHSLNECNIEVTLKSGTVLRGLIDVVQKEE